MLRGDVDSYEYLFDHLTGQKRSRYETTAPIRPETPAVDPASASGEPHHTAPESVPEVVELANAPAGPHVPDNEFTREVRKRGGYAELGMSEEVYLARANQFDRELEVLGAAERKGVPSRIPVKQEVQDALDKLKKDKKLGHVSDAAANYSNVGDAVKGEFRQEFAEKMLDDAIAGRPTDIDHLTGRLTGKIKGRYVNSFEQAAREAAEKVEQLHGADHAKLADAMAQVAEKRPELIRDHGEEVTHQAREILEEMRTGTGDHHRALLDRMTPKELEEALTQYMGEFHPIRDKDPARLAELIGGERLGKLEALGKCKECAALPTIEGLGAASSVDRGLLSRVVTDHQDRLLAAMESGKPEAWAAAQKVIERDTAVLKVADRHIAEIPGPLGAINHRQNRIEYLLDEGANKEIQDYLKSAKPNPARSTPSYTPASEPYKHTVNGREVELHVHKDGTAYLVEGEAVTAVHTGAKSEKLLASAERTAKGEASWLGRQAEKVKNGVSSVFSRGEETAATRSYSSGVSSHSYSPSSSYKFSEGFEQRLAATLEKADEKALSQASHAGGGMATKIALGAVGLGALYVGAKRMLSNKLDHEVKNDPLVIESESPPPSYTLAFSPETSSVQLGSRDASIGRQSWASRSGAQEVGPQLGA